jgi:ABC-type transport system involved in cytochrome c biogenesis permease subunit
MIAVDMMIALPTGGHIRSLIMYVIIIIYLPLIMSRKQQIDFYACLCPMVASMGHSTAVTHHSYLLTHVID